MPVGTTGDDLYAELLMLRTADSRTLVLLEGPSDCQALDTHIDQVVAHTVPGYSKTTVERALELADAAPLERVVAILDRDWVELLDQAMASENVVYTDDYDLDATVFMALDVTTRVLASTTNREHVRRHVDSVGMTPQETAIRMAGKIGLGRFVSDRDHLGVQFRAFPLHMALTADQDDVDLVPMATIAIGRSGSPAVQQAELVEKVKAELDAAPELLRFCSGHDIAAALAALVRGCWGGGKVSRQTMEQFGRAAFSCAALQETELYRGVSAWAARARTRVWNCEDIQ